MSTGVVSIPSAPPIGAWNQEEENLFLLLDKLEAFTVQGRDKRGRPVLRIVGKFYPARVMKEDVLRRYLEQRIFPKLVSGKTKSFCVVYLHALVQRSENFPGVSALRSIYEAIPAAMRDRLEAVYFVHPGLQSRLFLATVGRFLFSSGLYGKVSYLSRLEYLWEHMRRGEIEIPEFVLDHDEELEHRPLMDYGLEADHHHRVHDALAMDSGHSAASMYELRCIS